MGNAKQVSSMLKRLDADCDGRISLSDLMSFMNKASLTSKSNTDSPLEAKLRRVLAKAEQLGTPIEEAFKHFDKVLNYYYSND
jgi:Ca2+-binding EF-hand superfamily protein